MFGGGIRNIENIVQRPSFYVICKPKYPIVESDFKNEFVMYTILIIIGLIWSSGIEGVLHGMNKVGHWYARIPNWDGLEEMNGGGGGVM